MKNVGPGDEIIVIDDGSVEDYSAVISAFDPNVVKYHKTQNQGVSAARNKVIELSGNAWLAFLDDDDEWLDCHLQLQRKTFEALPELAGIFCNFQTTDGRGGLFHDGVTAWSIAKPKIQSLLERKLFVDSPDGPSVVYVGDHYKNQLSTDYILPSSFTINTKVVGKDKRFRLGLRRNQTYLFNSNICSMGPVAYIDRETCVQHGDAIVRATGIHEFDNVCSRLLVMSLEWGSNTDFLSENSALFERVFLMDFVVAFRVALSDLSVRRLIKLARLVGVWTFVKYAFRSIPLFFDKSKIERRVT
jgi:glycosyltransferase involved in cell wall biosynthesis